MEGKPKPIKKIETQEGKDFEVKTGDETEVIPSRTPVVNSESFEEGSFDKIEKQWLLLTEVIKQEIENDEILRNTIRAFNSTELTEQLANNFLEEISETNTRISNITNRYSETLKSYLSIDSVPDEQIGEFIQKSTKLETLQEFEKRIEDYPPEIKESQLERKLKNNSFLKGISNEEKLMVLRRYKFGRDVKLLALAAEIKSQDEISFEDKGNLHQAELANGTEILMSNMDKDLSEKLLDPTCWEKRRQIKDRVYEIVIGNKPYILKEKKTGRHRDKGLDKIKSLDSKEEFKVAIEMLDSASYEDEDIVITYEKPLAAITCPDGFQFSIFEFENNLSTPFSTNGTFQKTILENQKEFQEEFNIIKSSIQNFQKDPRMFDGKQEPISESYLTRLINWTKNKPVKAEINFTFEDFSYVKAQRVESKALYINNSFLKDMAGFTDRDDNFDFAMRVVSNNSRPQIEILNFDFEYIYHKNKKVSETYVSDEIEFLKTNTDYQQGLYFKKWKDGSEITEEQKAAYLAMLEKDFSSMEKDLKNK
ncbi:MAG: hypothetical protein ACI9AR_000306 [Flavobacteriaceae bacterium]|jgi:hypothetical protein